MIGGRSALLSAAGGGDPYGNWTGNYEDVSLLLRNGGGIGLADDSSAPKTVLATTPAGFTTQTLKYSVVSINNPIGGYFTVSGSETNPDFDFGSGNFTFEAWVYLLSNRLATLGSKRRAGFAEGWAVTTADFSAHIGGAWRQSVITASNPPVNTWFHYALVRSGDTFRMYHNGTQVGATYTQSGVLQNLSSRPVIIGMAGGTTEVPTDAIFDDLRISKVARYTSNFTPPTSRLPSGVTGDNVSLLFRGGTYASIPVDESPTPKQLNLYPTIGVSETTWKYSGSSLAFSGGHIRMNGEQDFAFGIGDFTIEFWINFSTIRSADYGSFILDQRLSINGEFMIFAHPTTGFGYKRTGPMYSNTLLSLNTWYHFALARKTSITRMFVNGMLRASAPDTLNVENGSNRPIIGGDIDGPGSRGFTGYIDDLRITKGVARYTKNFLPPPAELPAI